jgi:DNA repair protein RAD51
LLPIITTGSKAIDALLGGGIRTAMITDIFGKSGSGKSQLCFTLAANCAKEGNRILFIDTTGTFRPERIVEISRSQLTLDKITYIRAFSTMDQINATLKIWEAQPTLIVIDSLTSLFSVEYSGPELHRAIMKYLHGLAVMAITSMTAIVVTNMVRSAPPITSVDSVGRSIAEGVVPWQQREFLSSSVSIYSHMKVKFDILDSATSSFQAALIQPRGKRPVAFYITPRGISDENDDH